MDRRIVLAIIPIILALIAVFFFIRPISIEYAKYERTVDNCFVSSSLDKFIKGYKKVFEKAASWRGKPVKIMYFLSNKDNLIVYEINLGERKIYVGCKGKDIRELESKVQNLCYEVIKELEQSQ